MNELERIKMAVSYIVNTKKIDGITSQKELGEKLGYKNESSFSQILNGKVNVPGSFIKKFVKVAPFISEAWLSSGEGEMLVGLNQYQQISDSGTGIMTQSGSVKNYAAVHKDLFAELAEQRKLVEAQQELTKTQQELTQKALDEVAEQRKQTDKAMELVRVMLEKIEKK